MEQKKRYGLKKILLATLWSALGGVTIFLLVAGVKSKEANRCKGIEIYIHGVSNNFFVDKKDILNTISGIEKTNPVGKSIGSFNLKQMEAEIEKDVWIKSAQLFFDNNEILQVSVQEREPIARVFTLAGTTFYIDKDLTMLPLSEKFSARLPVFTGFPSDRKVLSKPDSSLLMDIKTISLAVQKDSFSMAMIEQIDITSERVFEMVPKIGNQLIVFGDAKDAETKLDKMKLFYKNVMVKAGWNSYSIINLRYKNQVVAKRKGAEDFRADSLRTLQLMKIIVERAQQQTSDSLQTILQDDDRNTVDSTMIQESIQRDETNETSAVNVTDPVTAPPAQLNKPVIINEPVVPVKRDIKPVAKPVQKPATIKKPAEPPKAVMPKKNDYSPVP